jgi:hypothetical protein
MNDPPALDSLAALRSAIEKLMGMLSSECDWAAAVRVDDLFFEGGCTEAGCNYIGDPYQIDFYWENLRDGNLIVTSADVEQKIAERTLTGTSR